MADIETYLKHENPAMNIEMPTFLQSLTSVIIQDQFGMVVKLIKGDTCIVSGGDNDEEEWIMEITHLIQVGHFGEHFFYLH